MAKKDYSEKVEKSEGKVMVSAEHTKLSGKIDDKKLHAKAVREEKKSKEPPKDIFDSLLDPNVQETKDRKLEKSSKEDLSSPKDVSEKTAGEPVISPPTKAKKRTSRSSRNVPEEPSTRSSSRNVPEDQPSTRTSSRTVPEEQPSTLKEDLLASPKDVLEKTGGEPEISPPTKAKKRTSRSSRNVPEEPSTRSSSRNVPDDQPSTSLNEDVSGPNDVPEKTAIEPATSPPAKAKKRTPDRQETFQKSNSSLQPKRPILVFWKNPQKILLKQLLLKKP